MNLYPLRYSDERYSFDELLGYLQSKAKSESKGNKNFRKFSNNKDLIFPSKYTFEFPCLTKEEKIKRRNQIKEFKRYVKNHYELREPFENSFSKSSLFRITNPI